VSYEAERSLAIETVLRACRLCQSIQVDLLSEEMALKDDESPVTVGDFSAQALIALDLHHSFPNDPIVAEESAADLLNLENGTLKDRVERTIHSIDPNVTGEQILEALGRGDFDGGPDGRFWVIDPIDGTKGFLRGEQYAVALALIENGEVVLGVLGCPNLPHKWEDTDSPRGCLFTAVRGEGAWMRKLCKCRERGIHVSGIADPSAAQICIARDADFSPQGLTQSVIKQLGVTEPLLRMDSQSKYITIARGDASIYLRMTGKQGYEEKIWDHAPGWLILKEAGGECTDAFGKPLDFTQGRTLSANTGIIATNGILHAQVIEASAPVMSTD